MFSKEVIGGNEMVATLFNAVFAIGIALGSVFCPYIIHRFHARDLSRIALTGVMLFSLDLCWVGYHISAMQADDLVGMMAFLGSSFQHIRITADLFLMAFCGGIFSVPLYTQLQIQSVAAERARTIASNNVVNALFIAVAFGISALMVTLKLTVLHVLLVFALLNIPVILLLRRMVVHSDAPPAV